MFSGLSYLGMIFLFKYLCSHTFQNLNITQEEWNNFIKSSSSVQASLGSERLENFSMLRFHISFWKVGIDSVVESIMISSQASLLIWVLLLSTIPVKTTRYTRSSWRSIVIPLRRLTKKSFTMKVKEF